MWMMSLDAFNELPEDIQQIVLEEAEKSEDRSKKACVGLMDEMLEFCKDKGLEICYPTEKDYEVWRERAKPIWDNLYKDISPEGKTEFIKAFKSVGVTYTPPAE